MNIKLRTSAARFLLVATGIAVTLFLLFSAAYAHFLLVATGMAATLFLFLGVGCAYYALTPTRFFAQLTEVVTMPVLAALYAADMRDVENIVRQYKVGLATDSCLIDSPQTWRRLETTVPGFQLIDITPTKISGRENNFVYEKADATYLARFREIYHLDNVIQGAESQYEAMLRLGAWIGTRWDHGSDPLVGSRYACDPTELVAAGERGAKYWCEIAARLTVHAASSLGWPARVITGSCDGYTWEHAVAELWSDDFGKWFVMDTDFNVVYESNGVPLSAFELSQEGPALQSVGKLDIRVIASPKPSLPLIDMIPFYRYIHVDLRNDWCSRPLRRGSPAGGNLATWWTARSDMPPLLTAKLRVNDVDSFNWTLNSVAISAVDARLLDDGRFHLEVALSVESPVFGHFEISLNDANWKPIQGSIVSWILETGKHSIAARMITAAGDAGRVTRVTFRIQE